MGWKGALIGSYLGGLGGGPLGALAGAFFGHYVEGRLFGKKPATRQSGERVRVFCASAAAMLAKMAKADGVVSKSEIDAVEQAFRRLGFSPSVRRYAVDVFRRAKDDNLTIYDYARDFVLVTPSMEVRELFYELLWDLAVADGTVESVELRILQTLPAALRISPDWFGFYYNERLRGGSRQQTSSRDELAEAYSVLGVSPSVDDQTVRAAYREKAKKYHPDTLKAQGLPDELIGKATAMMSKINAAWTTIKNARGL